MPSYPRLKYGWLGGKRELYISSPFGYRIHPKRRRKSFHYGVDISVPVGTEIKAPMNGTLKAMGVSNTAGLWCVLNSGNIQLVFMHLTQCAVGERAGATMSVSEGQLIGKTGGAKRNRLSGSSTGPHLHFEYRYSTNGSWTKHNAVDPKRILSERLTGKLNSVFSGGVPVKIKRRTGKEIPALEVGDMKPMEEVNLSEAEINEDWNTNVSDMVDEEATEDIDVEPQETVEGAAKGIWQIIKLAMDGNVASLMLFDASISQQTGSLMNFFNKACQQPLVEFSGDTFGDQYYFLVRRPPFDKEGMIKALNTQHLFEVDVRKLEAELGKLKEDSGKYWENDNQSDRTSANWKIRMRDWYKRYGYGTNYWNKVQQLEDDIRNGKEIQNEYLRKANPYVIEKKDIMNSNISFNTQGIYSWYQFYPQYELAGDKMQYVVPAVMFPEYAAVWGSRPLQIQSQYASFKGLGTRDAQRNGLKDEVSDKRCRSILDDLKYLIESNAYNPFVRQGTLTIIGTRRIRRGMFIEVCIESGVPEIFYVEGVSHSYGIQGNTVSDTTTLQLSHGMVKKYIKESNKQLGEISYFDLIEFKDYEKNRNNLNIGNWREVISHWAVNKEVFKFFLQKKQFIKGDYKYE